MSIYKHIIIFLSFIIVFKCAPPTKYVRQKNSEKSSTNRIHNEMFFNWTDEDINELDDRSDFITSKSSKDRDNGNNDIKSHVEYKNSDVNFKKLNKKYYSEMNYIGTDSLQKGDLKYKIYTIKKGDNLINLSKKYEISLDKIISMNRIKNNDKIQEGMKLKIPLNKKPNNPDSGNIANNTENPNFIWPIKKIYETRRDGIDGVKSIGIVIIGESSSSVLSSAGGIVMKVGYMRGFGKYVILKHNNKYLTIYSNLKEIWVNEGDSIKRGETIGRLEGNSLHFQIGHSGKPEDPLIHLHKKS